MILNDLITWILRRGVSQDDVDRIAVSLGLSPEVTDVDGFSRTVVYKSGSVRTACGHDILMRYVSGSSPFYVTGPSPSIRIARVAGLIPDSNRPFIRLAVTLRPAFTSGKKLERLLRKAISEIQDAESLADSMDIRSSGDILASLVENRQDTP